eukprot:1037463-Rhodomonas_salina.1
MGQEASFGVGVGGEEGDGGAAGGAVEVGEQQHRLAPVHAVQLLLRPLHLHPPQHTLCSASA